MYTTCVALDREIVEEFKKRRINISEFFRKAMNDHAERYWLQPVKIVETVEEEPPFLPIPVTYRPPTEEEYQAILKEREKRAKDDNADSSDDHERNS